MKGTEQNLSVGILTVPFSTAEELTLFIEFVIKIVENLTVQMKNHGRFCAFFFLVPGSTWDHFNVCYCTFPPVSFFVDLQPYVISKCTYCAWFFTQMLATSWFPIPSKIYFSGSRSLTANELFIAMGSPVPAHASSTLPCIIIVYFLPC